jgi:hypothetical protein
VDLAGVRVLLNNGDGTFSRGQLLPSGANGTSVVVGDFTGNGKLDIAVTSYGGHGLVSVYLGNGDGTFQTPLNFDLGFNTMPQHLTVGDFNGDGKPDLAVVYEQFVGPNLNSFVRVLLGNGDGTFQDSQTIQVADDSFIIATADLRGNGKFDLVTTSRHGFVDVLLGNGDGSFQSPNAIHVGDDLIGLAVGDFNGDGKLDLAVTEFGHIGGHSSSIHILSGNGDGTFQDSATIPVGQGDDAVVAGDFFGDGKLSLAVTDSFGNTVSVLRGNGDGTFQNAIRYLVGDSGTAPNSLTVGDFLGHGKIDLAVTNLTSNDVSVLLNQGNDTTHTPPTVESMVVNDGSVQRSLVTSLTVTFSTQVTLDDGALEVQRQDGSDVGISVTTSVVKGQTVAVITFTGPDIVGGSLPDGSYTLIVHSGLVHDGLGQSLQQDATLNFFRLLGDIDGDGDLDDDDLVGAPTVNSVRLNEGDTSGVQVRSITIHFSDVVSLTDTAFVLLRQDGTAVGLKLSTSVVDGKTVVVITFTGADLIDGALPDGSYTLTIHGDQIRNSQGQALGDKFKGDNSADFFGADGGDQPDLVTLFHPAG